MSDIYHGIYSEIAVSQQTPTVVWKDSTGKTFTVVTVYNTANFTAEQALADCKWPDKKLVSSDLVECVVHRLAEMSPYTKKPYFPPDKPYTKKL